MKEVLTLARRSRAAALAAVLAMSAGVPSSSNAGPPQSFSYQGNLWLNGVPVNASQTMTFRVTDASGVTQYWTSGPMAVNVSKGNFKVDLDAAGVPWDSVTPYVEITVGGNVMLPREPLNSVPYALVAGSVAGAVQLSSTQTFSGQDSFTAAVTILGSTLTITGQDASGYTLALSSGLFMPSGTLTAGLFVGNGAGLTNVTATGADPTKVAKVGDTMTGQLTLAGSSLTVAGNAFSVGGSTLVVGAGMIGVGTKAPQQTLDVDGGAQFGFAAAKSTFTSSPGGASYALQVASGVAIAGGGPLSLSAGGFIRFSDGTTQATASLGSGASLLVSTSDWTAQQVFLNEISISSGLVVGGGAFSVGGSTFIVTSGRVAIGSLWPALPLDVNGAVQFGADVTKSTFSSTGDLSLAKDAMLTVSGPSGVIVTGSSVTASAFFGDGSHLASVTGTDSTKVARVGDTMTGTLTMSGAAASIVSGSSITTTGGFFGDGSHLANVSGIDSTKVAKAGDTMTGQLTISGSTLTVTGSAFSVGGATLAVVAGNVGVGTSNPAYPLHVTGPAGSTGFRVSNAANTSGIDIGPGSSQGAFINFTQNSAQSYIELAGSNMITLKTTNEVSIGGDLTLGDGTGFLRGTDNGSTAQGLVSIRGGNSANTNSNGGDVRIYGGLPNGSGSNGNVLLAYNGAAAQGSVGIGTAIPAATLDVNGSAQFGFGVTKSTFSTAGALTLAANAALTLSGASGNLTSASSVTAAAFFGDGSHLTNVIGTDSAKVSKVGDTMTGQLTIAGSTLTVTGNAFSVGASTFVISSGNVGIGTASPSDQLYVKDSLTHGGLTVENTHDDAWITMKNVWGDSIPMIGLIGAGGHVLPNTNRKDVFIGGMSGANIEFGNAQTGTAEYMRITSGGNVGIGSTNPATTFDVNGGAQFGSGVSKSTFSTAGALTLAANAALTLSGASGNVTSASSVTAAAFFGDGSHLTSVIGTDSTKVAKAGDAMTGQLTISGSSHTIIDGSALDSFSLGVTTASDRSVYHLVVSTNGNVGLGAVPRANGRLQVSGQYYSNLYGLTDASSIAVDWNSGNVQSVTLGGSRTITFSNGVAGGRYLLILTQDSTGGWTVTWPAAIKWPSGTPPTLTATAGRTDILSFVYDGASYYGISNLNY